MKIYSVHGDFDHYDTCSLDQVACRAEHPFMEAYDLYPNLDGTRQGDKWWPRYFTRSQEYPLGRYISMLTNDILIMERQAITEILPVLGEVEILPIICDFGDYCAVNILTVLDAFDRENSVYVPFRHDPNRIMMFKKFAFFQSAIQNHHIFKIREATKTYIFVDDIFVHEVEKHNITGFRFVLEWETEAD